MVLAAFGSLLTEIKALVVICEKNNICALRTPLAKVLIFIFPCSTPALVTAPP